MNWAKPFHIFGVAMIFVTHRTIGQSEMTEFACPGGNLVLNCTNLGLIEVTRANYGRFSIEVCNPQSKANWSVNCFDRHAKNIIVKSCNGKALCSLSDEDFEGHESPCPETERYKEAHFTCQKEKEDQKTTKRTLSPIRLQTFRGQMPSSKEFPTDTNSRKRVPITAPPTSTFAQDQEDTSTISHHQLGGAERVHFAGAPAIRFSRHSLDTTTVPSFTQFLELPPTPSRLSVVKVVHKSETNIPVYPGFAAPVLSSSSSNSHQQESYPPCLSIRSRGVIWPSTDPGSTAQRPCPNNKEQVATWNCLRGPNHWTPSLPDMSKCQASWIKVPTWNTSGEAPFIVDLRDSLRSLKRHLQSNSIYGGDLMLVMGSLDKFLDDFGKSHGRSRDHDKGAQLDLETRTTFIQTISRLLYELSRPSIEATRFEEDKLESLIETVQRILVISSSLGLGQEWNLLGSDNDLHWRSQHLNISTASLKLQGLVNLSHKPVDDVLQSRPSTFCRMHVSVGSHQKNINRDDGNIPLVYLSMKLPSTFGTHLHQSSRIQGAKIAKRISSTILLINEDSSMFDISISGLREEEDKGARTSPAGCLATVTHVSDGLKHQCQLACSGSRSTPCQCQVVRFAQNGDAAFASTHLRPSSSWRENEKLTETSQVEGERSDINDQVVVLLGCLGATLLLIVAILPFACVLIHLKRAKVQQTSKECVYAGEAFHALDYSTCDGAYQSSLCRFDNSTYLANDRLRQAPSSGSALSSQELPQNTSSLAERLFIMPAGLEYQNALDSLSTQPTKESRGQENLCCNPKR